MALIGMDEAGRGPVIGPLVVCGVRTESDQYLRDIMVRDSKRLTPSRREKLASEILRACQVEIKALSAQEIDTMRSEATLNEIEAVCFSDVLKRLYRDGDLVFVDAADTSEARFAVSIMKNLGLRVDMTAKHKADDIYPVVAAASIVAKVRRDQEIRKIEMELRRELNYPLGSGYPSDPITMAFLEKWIKEKGDLPPHTRRSWKTVGRLNRVTLDDFEG